MCITCYTYPKNDVTIKSTCKVSVELDEYFVGRRGCVLGTYVPKQRV